MTESVERRVSIGRIVGVFGVKGWVKIQSWTRPPENILAYRDWQVSSAAQWRPMRCVEGRPHGKGFVAQVADATGQVCSDRDVASKLVGSEIAVDRTQLPAPGAGEHYWTDLIGFAVVHRDGRVLGELSDVLEFPAQDVMEVRGDRRRLIPFVSGPIVQRIDVDARRIEVDWAPDL